MWYKLAYLSFAIGLLGCKGDNNSDIDVRQAALDNVQNIIIIYADDLGYGQVGANGQTKILTPRLDELASKGVNFSQFYSSAAFCPPSRNSLLTGNHTGESQWKRSSDMFGEETTIADELKALGYDTSIFGKWGMSLADDDAAQFIRDTYPLCSNLSQDDMIRKLPEEFINNPFDAGFSTFVGFMQHRDAHVHYHDSPNTAEESTPYKPYYENVRQDLYQLIGEEVKRYKTTADQYLPDLIMEEALAHLRKVKDEKFFMYLASPLPHAELVSPPETKALYQQNGTSIFPETPWTGSHIFYRHVDEPRAELAGMITRLDEHIGWVLDELVELGIEDKTMVIVSSDNGPHMAGGINDLTFFNSSGGLKDGKWTLYEGGIRVPTIVYYPGIAAKEDPTPIAQYQIKDTLMELVTQQVQPRSFLPALLGTEIDALPYLYWQHYYDKRDEPLYEKPHTLQAVRKGDWKLVRLEPEADATTNYGHTSLELELYNLADDPAESQNLVQSNCDITRELIDILNLYATPENFISPIGDFGCGE
ncbi:sulfatase-like hydrolase/transferase [Photobacterium sp. BZF1]|uniref:sulfatase-like hydrolase/transferase n=1 Tax=Photobacterium sp. BZF1 TaxID=1904457 RepID=UPI00165347E1|nr:sulfatase-like hydrolase/transferase [Photobacterium sp. BZF1]MBC7006433.1 sulfatase-like hydrolase/transferase [Photobacterium sp. BZF1]